MISIEIFNLWLLKALQKEPFYFTLKALIVLKIFKFLSLLFNHVEKRLDKKDKYSSKSMTSHPGKETIATHMLTTISRSKGNQGIKFGQ